MAINNATLFHTAWTFLHDGFAKTALVWQRRRMVGRLGALDDRLLADMGITRYDVLSVLAEPLLVDPTLKLAERARHARLARRDSVNEWLSDDTTTSRSRRRAA